jgi:hypothetical protein
MRIARHVLISTAFAAGLASCGPSQLSKALCEPYRSIAQVRDSGVTKQQEQEMLLRYHVSEPEFVGVPSVEDYVYEDHPELSPDQLYDSCINSAPRLPGQI